MKKNGIFKILCLVLAVALLSPHVFAATPAPEAPLADAATVARVKQEIANGEITDMEDVFLVAYQHLGADIEEDGMTAYINPDGTLGFTQTISTSKSGGGGLNNNEFAITSILLVDKNGNQLTDYDLLLSKSGSRASGGLDSVMVYATHTMYITYDVSDILFFWVSLDKVTTTVTNASDAFRASRLVQSYSTLKNSDSVPQSGSQTLNIAAAGSYTYNVSTPPHDLFNNSYNGYIKSDVVVYIANTNLSFTVRTAYLYNDYNGINDYGGDF